MLKTVIDFQLELNIHQGGMTKEQAVNYMVRMGFQTDSRGRAEVGLDPAQSRRRRPHLHRVSGDPGPREGGQEAQGRRFQPEGIRPEAPQLRGHPPEGAQGQAGPVTSEDPIRAGKAPNAFPAFFWPMTNADRPVPSSIPTPTSTCPNSTPTGRTSSAGPARPGSRRSSARPSSPRKRASPTVLGLVAAHPAFLAAAGVHPHQAQALRRGPRAATAPGAGRRRADRRRRRDRPGLPL